MNVVLFLFITATVGIGQQDIDTKLAEMRAQYERMLAGVRDSYELRITQLEGRIDELRAEVEQVSSTAQDPARSAALEETIATLERQGIADASQSNIFDNRFNPAISVVGDFLFTVSGKDESFDLLDRFLLREVEVGFVGRVDPHVAYYVFLHVDEEELELEEGYGIADDWLPDTFTLKFGRYNVDFGKQSPIHDHDLPYVDKPGVLQEYLGGSLRGTGLELHHWFGVSDDVVARWSVGVVNSPDGDVHAVLGPLAGEDLHGEEGASFGDRDIEDFGWTARFTTIIDTSLDTTLQFGTSVVWAPRVREFEDDNGSVFAADRDKLTIGVDVTFKWLDPADGEGLTIGIEGLFNDERFVDETDDSLFRDEAFGFYAYGEYFFDPNWSVGASVDWFERSTDSSEEWFDVGAFVTWHVDEFNRLRAEVRYIDDDFGDDEYTTLLLQWTTILGSHGHGVDW